MCVYACACVCRRVCVCVCVCACVCVCVSILKFIFMQICLSDGTHAPSLDCLLSEQSLCNSNSSVIIIIIAFKGAIQDFVQSPHSAANCLQHARSSGSGAIVCKSRATHRAFITCNMSCYVPLDTKGQLSY